MDIHERQSFAPEERWRGFQFSTLVICILGVFGNVSSLIVLGRHLKEIAGSRLLLALGVADLGVVTSVASLILSYATYGNNWLTQVVDWWFLYCYDCSIYVTVLLSLDRYLHTAKAMLLRRIDYQRILKRVILAVFVVMLFISLPHLLGNFVRYPHGPHVGRSRHCPFRSFCENVSSISVLHKSCNEQQDNSFSPSKQEAYNRFTSGLCDLAEKSNYNDSVCFSQPVYVPTDKFKHHFNALYDFYSYRRYVQDQYVEVHELQVTLCSVAASAMRYDIDFVKAVYLGIDLTLRYVIPCGILVFTNIALVVSVRKAQRRHSDISQTASTSLLNMPVLRTALGIVFVFLICHTGGAGLFILDVFRAFAEQTKGFIGTTVNVFMDEDLATQGLEMKYSALLLAAVNSSLNVAMYCFFLPNFRNYWRLLFLCRCKCKMPQMFKKTIQGLIPLEEMETPSLSVSHSLNITHTRLSQWILPFRFLLYVSSRKNKRMPK